MTNRQLDHFDRGALWLGVAIMAIGMREPWSLENADATFALGAGLSFPAALRALAAMFRLTDQ